MRRLPVRIAVALFTFIIGVVSTSFSAIRPHCSVEKTLPVATVVIPAKPNHPEGWKKLDIDNKFSLYLPPEMKEEENVIGHIEYYGPTRFFANKMLGVNYCYVEKRDNQVRYRGRISCDFLDGRFANEPSYRSAEVKVGGREARLSSRQFENSKMKYTGLCFPELDDGTLLIVGAMYEDDQVSNVAKQIFDSIEFPSQSDR
jgi:hypothetical protein